MCAAVSMISFGVELFLLQLVLYTLLYPTRHKSSRPVCLFENERKDTVIGCSLTALVMGILSCMAHGNFAFFRLQDASLISDYVTWLVFYIVLMFVGAVLLSKIFHWTRYEQGEWYEIKKENIEIYTDFSPAVSLLVNEEANKQTGSWIVGNKTYHIIFDTRTHKEDMLAHLIQKGTNTYLCDKVILLGKPTAKETFVSVVCMCSRLMLFISTMSMDAAMLMQKPEIFEKESHVMGASFLCLVSAWTILSANDTKTDLFGKIIILSAYILMFMTGISMILFSLNAYL